MPVSLPIFYVYIEPIPISFFSIHPQYTSQDQMIELHIAQQAKHLNYISDKTDLLESIDQNMPKNNWKLLSDSSPKHTRDRFEKIVTTAFEAAAAEFPETLSHLKGLKLEKVCMIYSDEDWNNDSVRIPALRKLSREFPMILANGCAVGQERCPRKFLGYNHVERAGYEGDVSSFVYYSYIMPQF